MTIDSVSSDNANLNAILTGQSEQVEEKEDALGRDAFLTMLVAQLKHQDPLNPLEGTDFSAQLAQFSSLEQLFNVNDNLESLSAALSPDSEGNLLDYIGREITCQSDTLTLEGGQSVGGYYELGARADVLVNIYNSSGERVAQIPAGQQDAGAYTVEWNGTSDYGDILLDGTYYYEVLAVDENYTQLSVDTTLHGTVTGVKYQGGTGFLVVDDMLVNPATVTAVNQVM